MFRLQTSSLINFKSKNASILFSSLVQRSSSNEKKWIKSFSTTSPGIQSVWKELKAIMTPFMVGFKELSKDCKASHQVIKKRNMGDSISRKEMLKLRQTPKDLLKSLPLCLLFCVPLVGYVAPIISFKYPKLFLSHQFWTENQKYQFAQEDISTRMFYYSQLKDRLPEKALCTVEDIRNNMHFFEKGDGHLDNIKSDHLRILVHASLICRVESVVPFLPTNILKYLLNRRCYEINEDDEFLRNEGTEGLETSELIFACLKRGIQCNYANPEELHSRLRSWLSLSQTTKSGRIPHSVTLHLPAYFHDNHKYIKD